MTADLRQAVENHRWYHSIDLGDGLVTRGVDDSPARLRRVALPERLDGLSVLDIGAWDGFFSFECERRGASRVVAADYYSWHGSGWGQKRGFELARQALGSRVEDVDLDVMDLSPERVGEFDLVLFLGVLYHLKHPLLALERVASVSRGRLILETATDLAGVATPAMAFYPDRELNNDPTNWHGPNAPAVEAMLRTVGYSDVRTLTPRRGPVYRTCRALWHVIQGKERFGDALQRDRAVFHASMPPRGTSPSTPGR